MILLLVLSKLQMKIFSLCQCLLEKDSIWSWLLKETAYQRTCVCLFIITGRKLSGLRSASTLRCSNQLRDMKISITRHIELLPMRKMFEQLRSSYRLFVRVRAVVTRNGSNFIGVSVKSDYFQGTPDQSSFRTYILDGRCATPVSYPPLSFTNRLMNFRKFDLSSTLPRIAS